MLCSTSCVANAVLFMPSALAVVYSLMLLHVCPVDVQNGLFTEVLHLTPCENYITNEGNAGMPEEIFIFVKLDAAAHIPIASSLRSHHGPFPTHQSLQSKYHPQ